MTPFVPQRNVPDGMNARPAQPLSQSSRRFQPWSARVQQNGVPSRPKPTSNPSSSRLDRTQSNADTLHRENYSQRQTYHNTQFLSRNPYK